ncbi:MAG: hypothetical protein ABL949_06065 [Fimbriimonadaceae bacterium]
MRNESYIVRFSGLQYVMQSDSANLVSAISALDRMTEEARLHTRKMKRVRYGVLIAFLGLAILAAKDTQASGYVLLPILGIAALLAAYRRA